MSGQISCHDCVIACLVRHVNHQSCRLVISSGVVVDDGIVNAVVAMAIVVVYMDSPLGLSVEAELRFIGSGDDDGDKEAVRRWRLVSLGKDNG